MDESGFDSRHQIHSEIAATVVPVDLIGDGDPEWLEACRYFRLRAAAVDELARVKAASEAWQRSLQSRIDGLDYLLLGRAAEAVRKRLDGKAKSIMTPWGRTGFRRHPDRVSVEDENKIIAAVAEGRLPPNLLKHETKVAKDELAAFVRESGEIPDGVEVLHGGDEFYPCK